MSTFDNLKIGMEIRAQATAPDRFPEIVKASALNWDSGVFTTPNYQLVLSRSEVDQYYEEKK